MSGAALTQWLPISLTHVAHVEEQSCVREKPIWLWSSGSTMIKDGMQSDVSLQFAIFFFFLVSSDKYLVINKDEINIAVINKHFLC